MTTELPKLDRSLGPTPGATQFYRQLNAYCAANGKKAYNFGQGAEIDQPGGTIAGILAEKTATPTSPTYPVNGGSDAVREPMAGWVKRLFAIHATKTNTFVFGSQGRASLDTLFKMIAFEARQKNITQPSLLIGNTHWPMLDQHARFLGLNLQGYKMAQDNFPGVILEALQQDTDGKILAVYVNSPDNPTGIQRKAADVKALMDGLEKVNTARTTNNQALVRIIFDTPYFMACAQRGTDAPSLLDVGFDNVLDNDALLTPWFVDISFSKAYGFATPGLHTVITHLKYAKNFGDVVNTVYGNGLEIAFAEKVTRILAPENDKEAMAHFAMLKDKYTENKSILAESFGEYLVDGDPNMTCLMALPQDFFGRKVQGKTVNTIYSINDMNDFLEYCGWEKNVVFVNNGGHLARIAMAMKPENFTNGVKAFREAFDEVHQSEKLSEVA
jgi:hypothetical protein